MNREIIFRGKSLVKIHSIYEEEPGEWQWKEVKIGDWVYGYLEVQRTEDKWFINTYYEDGTYNQIEVDKGTVGQYTGLKDKNGKMIFEGDILQTRANFKGVVMWHRNGNFYINNDKELKEKSCENLGVMLEYAQFEVIGNIYDNNNIETK